MPDGAMLIRPTKCRPVGQIKHLRRHPATQNNSARQILTFQNDRSAGVMALIGQRDMHMRHTEFFCQR
ncbi:hypothetical protein D6T91_15490 [Salmonella enterica subsp. houtenae]|nr:hypothetical protein [Salmonella enterica]EBJ3273839.1 hypothetical protein [Salmonella enterica]EDO5297576.1 hypothetical protein [Salmonella enterica subsp. houtenae serovar 40:z4,z24:-]MCR5947302.1 hypothetical protein [Salmonella enterica subsp. houtenae]